MAEEGRDGMLFKFYAPDYLVGRPIDLVKDIPSHDCVDGLLFSLP
jgi:hypothetical protein